MIVAVFAAVLLGFLAGLWAFKVKSRWCPECGAMTTVHPIPEEGRRAQA